MKVLKTAGFLLAVILAGCSTLKLTQVDFAWPVESVLKIDQAGSVSDARFSYSLNVKPLFLEETQDSLSYMNKEVRIIRDAKGYYFTTAAGFKNVYLFEMKDGAFVLAEKYLISEKGMSAPVMNQRAPYIEIIDGASKFLLNNEGFKK